MQKIAALNPSFHCQARLKNNATKINDELIQKRKVKLAFINGRCAGSDHACLLYITGPILSTIFTIHSLIEINIIVIEEKIN